MKLYALKWHKFKKEELFMEFKEKKRFIEEKYNDAIRAIAIANDVDMGVAYDMLRNNVMDGGKNPYVNMKEAKKDFEELKEIAAE